MENRDPRETEIRFQCLFRYNVVSKRRFACRETKQKQKNSKKTKKKKTCEIVLHHDVKLQQTRSKN